MSNLIEECFAVETPKGNFQAKYVSTNWARGFDCIPSSCGLCCITELPERVSKKTFKPFDEMICENFNVERKICEAYDKRPWGCKTYPLIFGVENGQVIVSPSLECPSTNMPKINLNLLKDIFRNPDVGIAVDYLNDVFENGKYSSFWDSPKAYWAFLEDEINKYFDSHSHFPILNDLSELVYGSIDRYFGVKTQHPKYPAIYQLISSITNRKSVISTNFQTNNVNNVCYVRIHKFKIRFIVWNPFTGEIKTINSRLASKSQDLEIKKDGLQLLRDYFSLLFKRPFLSLSAVQLTYVPRMIPALLAGNFTGNLVHLEVAANLFAYKFLENGIDRNSMRGLLSFADGCLLSQFRNPKKSMHLV